MSCGVGVEGTAEWYEGGSLPCREHGKVGLAAKVSAVVVAHDSAADLRDGLPLLLHPAVEVIVVDNASADTSVAVATAAAGVRVTALPDNVGWSRGCNIGAGQAGAPVLAFVNPDTRVTGAQLLTLAGRLDDAGTAAVSPQFLGVDGRPQPFYFRFPGVVAGLFCFLNAGQRLDRALGHPFLRHRTYDFAARLPGEVDQPGAACLLARTGEFRSLGGFPEDLFLFFADTELCRRLTGDGRRVRVAWDVPVVHAGGGSVLQLPADTTRRHLQRDYLRYVRRNRGRGAAALTAAGVVVLTGLVPALLRVLRRDVPGAWRQLRLAAEVLR